MANQHTIQLARRTQSGSSAGRKLRRAGMVPAVLYGHGDPELVAVNQHDFKSEIKPNQYGSAIVRLERDGQDLGTALVKAVQANTLRGDIFHIDFQRVSAEDRINVSVPVTLTGEPAVVRAGGILEQPVHSVNMRCRADHVPEHLEFDISALGMTDSVHAAQLALPAGCELLDKPDEIVATILEPAIPALEEPVVVQPDLTGPELTGEKQKEDYRLAS